LSNKRPETQTDIAVWLYRLHVPFFYLGLSALTFLLLYHVLFPFIEPIMGLFTSLLVLQEGVRIQLFVVAAVFVLVPLWFQWRIGREGLLLSRKDLFEAPVGLGFLMMIAFVVGYIVLVVLELLGVDFLPFFTALYPQSVDVEADVVETMKWMFWYGLGYLLLYSVLSYPYLVLLRVYGLLQPLFLIPFLWSKANKKRLNREMNAAKEVYQEHQGRLVATGLLDEEDYEMDVLFGIIRMFEDQRIHHIRHGALLVRYEEERRAYHNAYLDRLRQELSQELGAVQAEVQHEQRQLDNDMERRLRGHVHRQKLLDKIDSGLDELSDVKKRYDDALFEYKRSR
jgi:hypothetical protein